MATLSELRDALFPAARRIVGSTGDRQGEGTDPGPGLGPSVEQGVTWVRLVRARVPAFDALEPGDLVLAPASALAVVAPGPAETAALVAAFQRARVSGVLVIDAVEAGPATGPSVPDAPTAVAQTAADAGLVTYRAARLDPAALERNVIAFLVNSRAELDHQAAVLEGRLERLALADAELEAFVAEIGRFLGRAVAVEGRRGDALAIHAPPDLPDGTTAVAAYLRDPRPVALRVGLPASGSLVLLGRRPPSDLDRIVAERVAGLVALQIGRTGAVERLRGQGRDGLPADGPPWVVLVARQVPRATARRTQPAEESSTLDQREQMRREMRLLASARRLVLRGDAESLEVRAVAAAPGDDPGALALVDRIASLLRRPVAVSRPFPEPGGRPAAEADARATLEAIEALADIEGAPRGAFVARADRLGAYQLLGGLHNVPDGIRLAQALLEPILTGRPAAVLERLETLRALLDTAGPAEAAAVLGVHRNTIAYRIRRIETMTGWRLSDPELRLPLAVAVRLVLPEQHLATDRQPNEASPADTLPAGRRAASH